MSELNEKSRRAGLNRAHRQANLRESLRAKAYVRILEGIAGEAHRFDKDEVPAYALKAKIYLDLLAKVLPDLKAVEHSGAIDTGKPEELTDDRLAHIASRSSNGTAQETICETLPSELH